MKSCWKNKRYRGRDFLFSYEVVEMIRKLTESDRQSVLEYLYKESSYNIFPIGDIEAFGFDKDFQTVFGEFEDSGEYVSILLLYRKNMIYYSHKTFFNPEYLKIVEFTKNLFVSGKAELIDLIHPYIKDIFKQRRLYFCKANELKTDTSIDESKVRILETEEDCRIVYDLLKTIDEFNMGSRFTAESFVESKMKSKSMGVTLFTVEDGIVTSTVATTAETTKNAMVVAVATSKLHRKKGYASKLMISLMQRYFAKGKELCLFYDNTDAGKIYLRLGFEYMGMWAMLEKI